jgi:mannose-1-phosphate guanylyltransferase
MHLIIFAGGVGTRLWPLSRENSPKQFDKIFSGKSTIQLAIDRIAPYFGIDNVFVQTVDKFSGVIAKQLRNLPTDHILVEPARRDLGPAVCFAMLELKKRKIAGPVALLWADHLMENTEEFVKALQLGENLIKEDPDRFIFLGEEPRFANNNLGWVKIGKKIGRIDSADYFAFEGWKYKPPMAECDKMYKSGKYYWNPGYFISSVEFILKQYKNLSPQIYNAVSKNKYATAEALHFDTAIIEKVDMTNAVVIKTNMGWSDPGTLYALKEALEKENGANVVKGNVVEIDSSDSLIYNFEKKKLITAVGLQGMVLVNTRDALIVVPKEKVVRVTDLLKKIKDMGLHEYL